MVLIFFIDVKHVQEAIKELKPEKSDGLTGFVSNNIICGPEMLHVYISLLFSCVLRHGYTSRALLSSVIIAIPKNVRGDLDSSQVTIIGEFLYAAHFKSYSKLLL